MCVKFATLRDNHALEAWICNLEPCHGLKSVCMDGGLWGLGELDEQLSEPDEFGHELGDLDEQLGEPDEFGRELDGLMNNSTSPLKFALNSTSR